MVPWDSCARRLDAKLCAFKTRASNSANTRSCDSGGAKRHFRRASLPVRGPVTANGGLGCWQGQQIAHAALRAA
jgi:hypothetical protein